jgi:hypothetical protein
MERKLVCSECGGAMILGVIPDFSYTRVEQLVWIKGLPKFNFVGAFTVSRKSKHYIDAYRCERCGFLKLYANPSMPPDK